ncbi:hypothetical protein BKI52_35130 [marine bacterium AO1-C]|nr:hypothetical protein BKI52_35130 [marine bacterium AO1-C]
MKKLSKTIIFSLLLLISISFSIFLFIQVRNLKSKLNSSQKKQVKTDTHHNSSSLLDHYLAVDTLLAKGKYNEAQMAYKKLLDKFPNNQELTQSIQLRIQNFIKLDEMQKKLSIYEEKDAFRELSSKMRQIDSISKKLATVEQTYDNQLDSLNFALKKAKVLTESLKRQLINKRSSDYLSFTNKKGVKVYYVGNVKDKKANGQGVGLYKNGSRYEGTWKNNMHHGVGTLYWPDGEYYEGSFQLDQRQGLGTYHWPSGDRFVGEWKEDKRNGLGTFYKKNGKVVAKGIWKNNKFMRKQN